MSIEQPNREENKERGDYVGYQVKTDEGVGIQIIGPMARPEAIRLATEIANSYGATAVRTFGKNKGQAILRLLEAFDRREKLRNKGVLS